MPLFDAEMAELSEAAKNFDGSSTSNGIPDPNAVALKAGPSQRMLTMKDSALNNPGTWGGDDRVPNPVPMSAYGYEGQGDSLFSLNPSQKG